MTSRASNHFNDETPLYGDPVLQEWHSYIKILSKVITGKEVRLLQALHFLEVPTRNEIARFTGLSAVSVTAVINRLLESGSILRVGKTSSHSGRPSSIYRVSPDLGYTVGVFFDASSLRLVALDPALRVLCRQEHPLALSSDPENHLTDILRQVTDEVQQLIRAEPLAKRRLLALGVTPPGMVDTAKGLWLHGMRVSGITHVALRELLEKRFSVPVVVEDPARCITWKERVHIEGEGVEPLVLLYLGEGVGAGIVINGELYRGANGLAGEIGHMHVAEEGDRCFCGNIGCLEMVVSESSILRGVSRRLREGVMSTLQLHAAEGLTLARILEAGKAGDRLAQSTLYDMGLVLGDACATLIELHNPRTLLIGGAVGALAELLHDPISLRLRQRVIPEMLIDMRLAFAAYQPQDEAVGAAMIAERHYWECLDVPAAGVLAQAGGPATSARGAGG
jgi:N-acetylglucosamine repressor